MTDNKFNSKFEESVWNASHIEPALFDKFDVKRGLRNNDKTGVLVGLTNIGDVIGYEKTGDKVVAIPRQINLQGHRY